LSVRNSSSRVEFGNEYHFRNCAYDVCEPSRTKLEHVLTARHAASSQTAAAVVRRWHEHLVFIETGQFTFRIAKIIISPLPFTTTTTTKTVTQKNRINPQRPDRMPRPSFPALEAEAYFSEAWRPRLLRWRPGGREVMPGKKKKLVFFLGSNAVSFTAT
jgi:hypothetical protein